MVEILPSFFCNIDMSLDGQGEKKVQSNRQELVEQSVKLHCSMF